MSKPKPRMRTKVHSKWRNDADFVADLPDFEREWYEHFVNEYYHGNFPADRKQLHRGVSGQRECWRRINTAASDIVTVSKTELAAHQAKPIKFRAGPGGYKRGAPYTPQDYSNTVAVEATDDENNQDD